MRDNCDPPLSPLPCHNETVTSDIAATGSMENSEAPVPVALAITDMASSRAEMQSHGEHGASLASGMDPEFDAIIRLKAYRLSLAAPFSRSDAADIEQELRLAWHLASGKYVTSRGSVFSYRKTVIERAAAVLLAHVRAAKRWCGHPAHRSHGPGQVSLDIQQSDVHQDRRRAFGRHPGRRFEHEVDVSHDVGWLISTLQPRQQRLCQQLMFHSAAEVSRLTGVPESTVGSQITSIRRHFEKLGLSDFHK